MSHPPLYCFDHPECYRMTAECHHPTVDALWSCPSCHKTHPKKCHCAFCDKEEEHADRHSVRLESDRPAAAEEPVPPQPAAADA